MALTVAQYEEIVGLLSEVRGLVDRFGERDPGFPDAVLEWLIRAERALERNRLPTVSQLATARAALIGAGRGMATIDVSVSGRPTTRKLTQATANVVLQRGNELLQDAIAERQAVFGEAERIARQTVAVADAKQLLPSTEPGRSQQGLVEDLRDRIAADPDLASAHLHLASLVGRTDVLVFLDRALAAHQPAPTMEHR